MKQEEGKERRKKMGRKRRGRKEGRGGEGRKEGRRKERRRQEEPLQCGTGERSAEPKMRYLPSFRRVTSTAEGQPEVKNR
jgi:hypothetical protein